MAPIGHAAPHSWFIVAAAVTIAHTNVTLAGDERVVCRGAGRPCISRGVEDACSGERDEGEKKLHGERESELRGSAGRR
jgi:hypothetical protein